MKKFLRIVALAMLLALVVGALPAMAATTDKTRKILPMTLYTGTGEEYVDLKGWTGEEEDVTITSSDPSVLKVDGYDYRMIIPLKAGKAKITIQYKLNGEEYQISRTFTVKKYPGAIASLKINKKKIKLKDYQKLRCYYMLGRKEKSMTINMKPTKGWKITGIKATGWKKSSGKKATLKIKNNKKFSISKYSSLEIIYTLKKGAEKFTYAVYLEEDCY